MKIRRFAAAAAACIALLPAQGLSAQAPGAGNGSAPALTASRATAPPVVDGRLDDAAWAGASALGGFVQREPFEGQPASERTEVRVLFDDEAVYIGAWLFDREPGAIVAGESRRDKDLAESDAFRVIFDTFLDRQNGFVFGTTPAGIEHDGQVTREGQGGFTGQVRQQRGSGGGYNINWDGSWEVATSQDAEGWYAEFRIPFATLRYGKGGAQRWGLNFGRTIRRRNEEVLWAPVPRNFDFYRVSMAGTIRLEAPARRAVTVTPYALTSGRRDYVLGGETDYGLEAGADAKLGLTQSLTLDLTLNTDFAQVEVDEEQINLTRFRLFFPEKRPFFLENAGTFAVGTPQEAELFFSRRIGIQSGAAVPIMGGGRLTGKAGGFDIGLLSLQTDRLNGVVDGLPTELAPPNHYSVLRVLREMGNRTRLGGMAVSRINTDDGADHNYSFALDGRLGLGQNLTFDGYAARTDMVDVEGGETAWAASGSYAGRTWEFGATLREVGENFEPEVGFVPRTAYRFRSLRVLRHVRTPNVSWFRELRPHISYRENLGLDGFSETRLIHIDSHFEFADGAFFQLPAINFTREGLREPFEIAEGVVLPAGTYDNVEWGFDFNTNRSARLYFDGRTDIGGFYSGHRAGGNLTIGTRIGDALVADLGLNYYAVWLREGDFETALARLRVAWSFTPRIYLQALLQYNDQTDTFSSNLRFGWLGTAGTGLYLVYNDTENTGPFQRTGFRRGPLDRTLVLKFTRQFELGL
jgi:hypothetical protein